ncbi:unnamed protein product [Leptidea sinapis]|uniref:Endonuclease/exonuclease/phosphatase domain-containing protein n=1 Tax=Leptidea sinapis TaxID=189913 RepID=A0A5E4QRS6_9NEOP|nr:unnamed protein product [Leptidea sinapis]
MPSLLDLLMTTHPDSYQVTVDAPLGTSDHCLVRSVVPIRRQRRRTWVAALGTKDPNCIVLKRKYNRASRFFKRKIARAKSKHVVKIGEQLSSYPTGTRKFWSLPDGIVVPDS